MEAKDPHKGGTPVPILLDRPVDIAPAPAPVPLLDIADELWAKMPGHRVEIIEGRIIVTPPADDMHSDALRSLTLSLGQLHRGETLLAQAIGVWLGGTSDYAVPDFAVVDADYKDHLVKYNCYDPAAFRLVLEVTSSNRGDDLIAKRVAYAAVGIPAYVIVDRREQIILVLTDPHGSDYRVRATYRHGETFKLPDSVGTAVEVEVDVALGLKVPE
jgi:Uma2 family endonuclease